MVLEIVEGEGADADLARDEFLVFRARFFSSMNSRIFSARLRITSSEEARRAGASVLLPFAVHLLEDDAERNVVHVFVPFAAHLLENMEHLFERSACPRSTT